MRLHRRVGLVQGRPADRRPFCRYHHMGIVVSGTFHVEMEDGLSLEIPPNGVLL